VCPTCHKAGLHKHPGPPYGTLGYGKPGIYPGFQGFGLGYFLGYGYGGVGLGVGAEGGYPFYGGPGYPHPWPRLRRIGGINPFPYFGGPGYPTPDCPNYFGGVGPLVADPPVIEIEGEPGEAGYASGYGYFTGSYPYSETVFAPFTTRAAAAGTSSGVSSDSPPLAPPNPTPAPGEVPDIPAAGRRLGIVTEPVDEPDRTPALKVTRVEPGSAAETAGLHVGDVIRSINGYVTQQPAHLVWILANAAPDNVLKASVRTATDRAVHPITIRLP
jgi:hypothetical protein